MVCFKITVDLIIDETNVGSYSLYFNLMFNISNNKIYLDI